MTISKMVGIVIGATAIGAVIGLGIGAAIGTYTPDLYRVMFPPDPRFPERSFDPVQIGVGLGIIQGLGMGFLLGCVILITSAIRSGKSKV